MSRWSSWVLLLSLVVSLAGCGGVDEIGPVDPNATPQVSEEELKKRMEESMKKSMQFMPPQQRAQMQQSMKKADLPE